MSSSQPRESYQPGGVCECCEKPLVPLVDSEGDTYCGPCAVSLSTAKVEELQAGVDRAYGAMSASAYVGGPSPRDAWRTALDALGPLATQHTGQAAE